ncbi:hypothetical protein DEI93_03275 [Curtobacterium sp. MCBD17_035]|uniref:hypothetical protein n=1 Tax=Curtobacterium sp. MCBD17_035 TaxID=2175673 RepID=UPI000DA6FD92|nr:hypothetical protein [Curtobacterium sp. MCBD17_035]WIB68079.1 hypothetical protein DEI93_03275 [Curtobacterium sp. MCBD17_035]
MSDTEVGGIKGFLSLDDTAWDATVAKVKADAEQIGRLNPNIRVTLDTASAEERLAALDAQIKAIGSESVTVGVNVDERSTGGGAASAAAAAEAQLAAAQDKAESSAQRAARAETELAAARAAADVANEATAAAEAQLTAVRESQTSTTAQLVAAQEALAVADAQLVAAADAAAAAETAQAAAQAESAATAAEDAAAQEAEAGATTSATAARSASTDSIFSAVSANKLQLAAIVALITALGPLTAASVAYAGALTGMGAAGVLAVLGIKNEMTAGTAVGDEYGAGLQSLKGDLDELSGTAALGMLSSFEAAQKRISADMPELNQEVATFTGELGQTGTTILDALLTALPVINPLLQDGAAFIQRLAQSIDDFAAGNGLKDFVTYAESELPIVEDAIMAVAHAGIEVVTDLAPFGQILLQIITLASEGYTALHSLSLGFGESASEAEKYTQKAATASTAGEAFRDSVLAQQSPISWIANAVRVWQDNVDGTTAANKRAAAVEQAHESQISKLAATYGMTSGAYEAAAKAADKQTASTKTATQALQLENDAAGLLTNALTLLNGGALSVAQAQTGVASATNSAVQSFKDNKTAIDGNSAAAVANQQAIQQQVQSAQQLAEAQAKATGSTAAGVKAYTDSKTALEGALKAQGSLTPAVQAYIDKLYDVNDLKVKPTKFEIDKAAADKAIADFKGGVASVPGKHNTSLEAQKDAAEKAIAALKGDIATVPASKRTELRAEIAAAKAALQQIKNELAGIQSKTVTITTRSVMQKVGSAANDPSVSGNGRMGTDAHGGTIGGRDEHVQHFALGGTSGTVTGSVGSSTSDSLLTRLSLNEEVVNAYASSYPGARAVIKSINANPGKAMDAINGGGGTVKHIVELRDRTDSGLGQFVEATVTSVVVKREKRARTQQIGGTTL